MIDTIAMNEEAFRDERKTAKIKATFNDEKVITHENIINAKFIETMADKSITIGAAFSQSIEMTVRMQNQMIEMTGAKIVVEASFDGTEWVKLGIFYVSNVQTTDNYKTVSITAVDRMALLTDQYIPAIALPATQRQIVDDIAAQYGIEIENIKYSNASITQLFEGTVREYLGWMAGLSGANARFNRRGRLEFTWYEQVVTLYGDVNGDGIINDADVTYINDNLIGTVSEEQYEAILGRMIVGKAYVGAEVKDEEKAPIADVNRDGIINDADITDIRAFIDGTSENTSAGTVKEYAQLLTENRIERNGFSVSASELYTITALVSGTEDSTVESGRGKAIKFYNPYMTKEILDEVADRMLPFTYLAAEVMHRGNPAWEIGDIIRVDSGEGYNVPIMSQTLEFGKKFLSKIKSLGASDAEESATQVVPDVKKIERKLPGIKAILTEINESLLSDDAGYMDLIMETIDGVDRLSGFRIMDTPVMSDSTKGWIANKNGIGWSSDGFKTISKIGLDMSEGKIYADQIAAGAIITNSFQIGDAMTFNGDTGEITFGSKVKMSWDNISSKPDDLAHTSDIPDVPTTDEIISNLQSNDDFNTTVTNITNRSISTAEIRADQITTGKIDTSRIDLQIYSNNPSRNDGINVYYGNSITGIAYNSVGYELTSSSDPIEGACIGRGLYFVSGPALEVWSNSGDNYSYVTPTSIVENGISLSSKYAAASHSHSGYASSYHTHSQYYESGDNIVAGQITLNSPVVASVDPVYRSTNSYRLGTSSSLRKYKNSIGDVTDDALRPERLYDLPVRQFKWNKDVIGTEYDYEQFSIGFIAEEVDEIYPRAAIYRDGELASWSERNMIPAMLQLIQEQKKAIDKLRKMIEKEAS